MIVNLFSRPDGPCGHAHGRNRLCQNKARRRHETAASSGEFERIFVKEMHRVLHHTKCRKALRQKGLKRKRKERKCTFECTFA